MSIKQLLLGTSLLGGLIIAAPAFAQEPPAAEPETPTEVGEVIITGSRIPRNEFTSVSPIQVLTAEQAEARGQVDVGQVLQSSSLAAGSSQNNATISSSFVTDGGPGSSTISLRGLGANRTLVLLNGRRAGPAGTRGGVSAVDLNVLPTATVERIDILKDGASSIYGSDAIAGVVNIITDTRPDGGEVSAFYSAPEEGGGEEANYALSYGKTFDRGHFNVALDYYKQFELKGGDREYTQCAQQVIFDKATGKRADRIDPRTGKFACLDSPWGHVWVYDENFSTRDGRFQFDYDGDLANYIPTIPADLAGDYPSFPSGFFLVGQDPESLAVQNSNHPFQDAESLIPELKRTTLFFDGAYEIGSGVELYGEFLLNRRESRTTGYRQYWTYNYTTDFLDLVYGGGGGDPFSAGFSGPYLLSPTPVTDHFGASQKVDYGRLVAGMRGELELAGTNWKWDIYAQHSISQGTYTQDVILDDAVNSQSFRTGSCVGSVLPISGRPCIDINFTDPDVLAGNLTDEQRAFLFDVDKGRTEYVQDYIEGYIGGSPWTLPAGDVGVAVGFHFRKDTIDDVPGPVSLAGNSWGLTSAGITSGSDTTSEIFGELAVPLLEDRAWAKTLGATLSARYTDVESSGGAATYKVGLNWDVTDQWKLRGTYGTSFRAPALFELYLADQNDFLGQRALDPCINWGNALANGDITQETADNCANPAGPGGGVPANHTGSGSSANIITGGGFGILEPETSNAAVVGVVWRPKFADLSIALDFFKITIKDEVTNLGSSIVQACYASDTFPTDPVCDLFDRNAGTKRIDEVRATYLNVARQENEGVDLTVRYRKDFAFGDLVNNLQMTYQNKDETELFADNFVDNNGTIGYPKLVGSNTMSLNRGPLTLYWNVDYVGSQEEDVSEVTINGVIYGVKAKAEAKFFHSLSAKYEFDHEVTISGGVSNVFAEEPPVVTTVSRGLGEYDYIGYSALTSQYTEAYKGRRAFVKVSKRF